MCESSAKVAQIMKVWRNYRISCSYVFGSLNLFQNHFFLIDTPIHAQERSRNLVHFWLRKGVLAQEEYGGIEDFALMSAQRLINQKPLLNASGGVFLVFGPKKVAPKMHRGVILTTTRVGCGLDLRTAGR